MYVRDSRCEVRLESTGRGGKEERMIIGREVKKKKDSADALYARVSHFVFKQVMFK